jgi:hypothetical protein
MRTVPERAATRPRSAQLRRWRYCAFGLTLESDIELPGMRVSAHSGGIPVHVELASRAMVDAGFSGALGEPVWETVIDGRAYRMERGGRGDHRLTWAGAASFLLSPDARSLICAPLSASDRGWQRLLMDTVLWTASLLHGFELLHASAVLAPGGVIAFAAGSGHGKSSIAWELVRRGMPLVADDVLPLRGSGHSLLAYPGPPLMTLDARVRPGAPARPVAHFGEEVWASVPGARAPAALTAVCLLERAEGLERALEPVEATALTLLPHSLGFPHLRERQAARFRLFGDVALGVPVYRLSADPEASPAELADLVEQARTQGGGS